MKTSTIMTTDITHPRRPVVQPESSHQLVTRRRTPAKKPGNCTTARSALLLASGLALWLAISSPQLHAAPTTTRFRLLTSSGPIGSLAVTENGRELDTDFQVDDNGRGPKIKEHIILGPTGLPQRWEMDGHTD